MRDYKEIPLYKDVTTEQWNDWKWQVANRITTVQQLKQVLNLSEQEEADISKVIETFRMGITPYYATLMDPDDPRCPIRMQAVPRIQETYRSAADMKDPLGEDASSPTPGLTHKYPDRVLFLMTDQCSMYCRHCTRRRVVGETDGARSRDIIDQGIQYIRNTPVIRDVLLSGGDGLLISDDTLEYVIKQLKAIPHVEIIRIGTRVPVVMPQRITDDLVNMLKKYEAYTKPLTDNDRKRLLSFKDRHQEVIDYMLKHNVKLEQEIIGEEDESKKHLRALENLQRIIIGINFIRLQILQNLFLLKQANF
mgnify:CR=1 FL=1